MVWFGAVFSLGVIGVLALMAVLGVWVVLSASGRGFGPIRRGARRVRHDGGYAVCGACGHAVGERITGERCGECGTPYLRGGIVTTATVVRLGPPFLLALAMVLAACLFIGAITVSMGMTLGTRAAMGGGPVSRLSGNQSYGPGFMSGPRQGQREYEYYVDFDLTGPDRTMIGAGSLEPNVEPQRGTLTLGLRGQSVTPVSLDYDVTNRTWSIPTRGQIAGASGTDVESAVHELFKRGSPTGHASLVADELQDAILIANTMAGEGPTAAGVPSISMEISQDGAGLSGRGAGWGSMPAGPTLIGEPATLVGIGLGLAPPIGVFVLVLWLVVRSRRRALSIARSEA